jgi:hypothetical protein
MPGTALIPIIDVKPVCSWCSLALDRDLDRNGRPVPPIRPHGRAFHTVCVRAYARDFADRIEAQWETEELPELVLESTARGTSDPSA